MFHRRKESPPRPSGEQRRTPSGWHQEDWESYDHVADAYDRVSAERTAPAARDLVALAEIGRGQSVLDVGSGTGVAAREAVAAVGEGGLVVGLDPAPRMLAHARRRGGAARWVVGEALDLPFAGASFDRVIGNFVVAHFNRYQTALFDMLRVLRAGGRLALSNWGSAEDAFGRVWREVAESLVGKELFRDAIRRAAPWQAHFSDPAKFEETLKDAGLRQVRVEHRGYRFDLTIATYLEGIETRSVARSLHRIMGDAIWERFRGLVEEEFRRAFRDPIGDTRDVWLGVGTKP